MQQGRNGWSGWMSSWAQDFKLGVALLLCMMLIRLALLSFFYFHRTTDGLWNVLLALKQGWRYDCRIAATLIAPLFLAGIVCLFSGSWMRLLQKIRRVWGSLLVALTISLGIVDVGFFSEFHSQFNYRIYGIIYDDFWAILDTIWRVYPIVWIGIGWISLIYVALKVYNYWMRRQAFFQVKAMWLKVIIPVVFVCLFIFGLRGTIYGLLLKEREVQVTNDTFLTEITLNPYYALYFTHKLYSQSMQSSGIDLYIPSGDIKTALQALYPEKPTSDNLADWVSVKTQQEGLLCGRANHIFIVVMESQEGWTLLPKYRELGLTPNLVEFATKGAWVQKAIASGGTTIDAMVSVIAGIPSVGVFPHYRGNDKPYLTALAPIAKRLGYQSNLFFGGSLTWENLGNFAQSQGFNIYSCIHLDKPGNRWGVDDEHLFDFILATIAKDVPSQNVIMTTSNHPPHSVDIYSKGFPLTKIPETFSPDESNTINAIGHYWYVDKVLGAFVEKAEKELEKPLFVFTADHTSGRFLNAKPTPYERVMVPLIFYSKEHHIDLLQDAAGCHIDIAPTLVGLLAPKGFSYATLGHDLRSPGSQLGIHPTVAITPQSIVDKDGAIRYNFVDSPLTSDPQTATKANTLRGCAWWLVMRGESL